VKYARHPWSKADLRTLRRRYPHVPTADLAKALGRPVTAVFQQAAKLGLHKTAEYLASPVAHRADGRKGMRTRFQKGNVPWNKGTHYTAGGRSGETRFKRGNRPRNWMPVGSYRVNGDGYLDRKVNDTGYPPRDWVSVHRLVWIAARGPIPPDHAVAFLPGRRTTDLEKITLDALELVHRRELMRRNTVHNLPKPLASLVQLRGALVRRINARERAR